jgi:hypothetical protein
LLQYDTIFKQKVKRKNVIAIDCSTNVLSYEWPIAFVIDASDCKHSKSLASPVISFSRATSRLIVIETDICKTIGGTIKSYASIELIFFWQIKGRRWGEDAHKALFIFLLSSQTLTENRNFGGN